MNGFEVMRDENGEVSVLRLKGFLDAHTASDLERAMQKLLDDKRFKIIVNFKDLTYISSAGLGVFMGFIEEVRTNGGDIKLTNMNPKIFVSVFLTHSCRSSSGKWLLIAKRTELSRMMRTVCP